MLVARSAPECRLYMDLRPCSCGESRFSPSQRLVTGPGGTLTVVYAGECPRCGVPRRFEFELDPEIPPLPPAFGGDKPSSIICPGQFAIVADHAARSARVRPDGLADEDRLRSQDALAVAVAALREVLKFIPAGRRGAAVPAEAFTSPEGAAVYAHDPGRFTADRIEAVIGAYQEILGAYGAAA